MIYVKRRKTTKRLTIVWNEEARRNQNVEAFLKSYGSLAPKRYTNAEIKKMTNDFREKLGEGGFGAVYKGSCLEGNKQALVYEFMPNGSLERFINKDGTGEYLPSETMFGIALGIAKGLDYLHRGCNMRILHFDIKPHNILLDKQLVPKISDFGLARLCSSKDSFFSMTGARGTIGYIAPEVFLRNFGGVSHKSDVYSYGMILLDMVCGRNDVDVGLQNSSEAYFPDCIYRHFQLQEESGVHHDEIMNNEECELEKKMILVGLWCIQTYSSNRPAINRAIEMLEGPLNLLQVPPKPLLTPPPPPPPHSVLDSSGTRLVFNLE